VKKLTCNDFGSPFPFQRVHPRCCIVQRHLRIVAGCLFHAAVQPAEYVIKSIDVLVQLVPLQRVGKLKRLHGDVTNAFQASFCSHDLRSPSRLAIIKNVNEFLSNWNNKILLFFSSFVFETNWQLH